jgi:tRNA (cmo5U34)-methyltransferase
MIGLFTAEFAQENSHCYDLGCSLGAATLAMRHHLTQPGCRIIAVDNSASMIKQCQSNIEMNGDVAPVDLICADIRDVTIENASVVILNFTLQFIEPQQRDPLLHRIYNGLNPGGIVVISEKVTFADPNEQQLLERMHIAFKRANGYSDLEISQKRSALDKVLIPETIENHFARFERCGFSQQQLWHKSFNFTSMIAIK